MINKFFYEGINLKININLQWNKNRKYFSLQVKNQELLVKANPLLHSIKSIESLIKNQEDKIIKFLEKQKKLSTNKEKDLSIEDGYFYLFGKKYNINFTKTKNQNYLVSNGLILKISSINKTTLKDNLKKILEEQLKIYLEKRSKEIAIIMNSPFHQIEIRNKKTAWATNYVSSKKIFFSKALVPFSKEIIDYVIIHELAHHFESNHSRKFWAIVYKFCPNFKLLKNKLNRKEYA